MKLLVCALTSHDATRLNRLIESVKLCGYDTAGLVVCNTLDREYPQLAQHVARMHGWDFVETESNGMPGKGKNSALSVYAEHYSDFDHLLLMDGDDFLYPCALSYIARLVKTHRCDLLGLQTNDILDHTVFTGLNGRVVQMREGQTNLYSWFTQQRNLYSLPEFYHKVDRSLKLGEHSTPDRIILFSREVAAKVRCSEKLPVYEDYVLSLNAQALYLSGRARYINVSTTSIYVYDKTGQTSTCKEYDSQVAGDWAAHEELFKDEIAQYEPALGDFHASEVPFVYLHDKQTAVPDFKLAFLQLFLANSFEV